MAGVTHYDPPSGWMYGFPKPYRPRGGESLAMTLLRDGYPLSMIPEDSDVKCRFIGRREDLEKLNGTTVH